MKATKRLTALLLCALMVLSSVVYLPVSAEATATETDGDYFYKYDFNELTAGDVQVFPYDSSVINPYGFALDSAASISGIRTTVKSNPATGDNYLQFGYNGTATTGWAGARFLLVKDGDSYSVANTLSFEFDIRWQGVSDTEQISTGQILNLLRFRRNGAVQQLLSAQVVSSGSVADYKLKIFTPDGQNVATLVKGSSQFTNIKAVYYDVTQTYSVYVNGEIVVEAKAAVTSNNTSNDLRRSAYIKSEYDADFMNISREEVSGSDGIAFTLARVDYGENAHTPYILDVDNVCIKEVKDNEGRQVYYENSFEGANTNFKAGMFVSGDNKTKPSAYNFYNTNGLSIGSAYGNGYLAIADSNSSAFQLCDVYQVLQDGNWTLEFDVRATNTNAKKSTDTLIRIYDGVSNFYSLHIDGDNNIYFGSVKDAGAKKQVYGSTMKKADSDEWTHIAISMVLDTTNKNKSNWLSKGDSNPMKYCMYLWVDGVYAGSYDGGVRQERNDYSTSQTSNTINYNTYTRTALDAEPDTSKLTAMDGNTDTLKRYYDENGVIYQLAYDADGAFVAGSLPTTTTATGSIKLTPTENTGNRDYIQFFTSSSGTNVYGAIDNIELYEGVIPTSLAHSADDTKGVVVAINYGGFTVAGESLLGTTEGTGIMQAVNWNTNYVTQSSDSTYVTISRSANVAVQLRQATPNVAGKTYSAEIELRNLTVPDGVDGSLVSLRRQTGSATAKFVKPMYMNSTGFYFTTGSGTTAVKNYLCYSNGTLVSAASETDWLKLQIVVDESGTRPSISYLADGKPVCYGVYDSEGAFAVKGLATSLSITNENCGAVAGKGFEMQSVRVFDIGGTSFTADLKSFRLELVDPFTDSAMIDFSDYNSIDELSPQFYRTEGVKILDGKLIVPEGETFEWIDINKSFYKCRQTNDVDSNGGLYVKGYNIEARAKTDAADSLITVDINGTDSVLATSNGVNPLSSDRYTDVSATFGSFDGKYATFVDSSLMGFTAFSTTVSANSVVSFGIAPKSEVSELYIHADLERELSKRSGDVIKVNAVDYWDKGNNMSGILDNTAISKSTVTDDGCYSWDFTATATPKYFGRNDIYIPEYIDNEITVFEFDLKVTPAEEPAGKTIEMLTFRKMFEGQSAAVWERYLYITDSGTVRSGSNELLKADGEPMKVTVDTLTNPDEDPWHHVAVIYDAVNGTVSYRIDGDIPYYKDGDELIRAEKIALSADYSATALENRWCTLGFAEGFAGAFDLKEISVYKVDSNATADLVGVQVDTANSNIRLVAGVDMLYYSNAGFELAVVNDDSTVSQTTSYDLNKAWSSIKEDDEESAITVYPSDYGWRYFFLLVVEKVDTTKPVKLIITPYTSVNGVKSYGETSALNIDFTSDSMNDWTYELEDYSPSSAEITSLKVGGDTVGLVEGRTDYYRATNGSFSLPSVEVETKSKGANVEIAQSSDGYEIKVTSADGTATETTNIHFVATKKLDSYDLDTWLIPYWQGDTVYHESAMFVGNDPISLMYTPEHILSIRSCDLKTEYVEGVDYEIKDGKICRLKGSRMPWYTADEFYPESADDAVTGVALELTSGGYILGTGAGQGKIFQQNSVFVTYTHKADKNYYQPQATTKLSTFLTKLENGEEVNIVFFGDSITAGSNATGFEGIAPYTPRWTEMVTEALREKYHTATINYTNTAVGGKNVVWGAENFETEVNAHDPDLLVLGFGMNDAGKTDDKFIEYIKTIVDGVLADNSECEILVVGSMLWNPDVKVNGIDERALFEAALVEFAKGYDNVDVVPMTSVHSSLLETKRFFDISSNNHNHPSDFLVRVYAQTVLEVMGFGKSEKLTKLETLSAKLDELGIETVSFLGDSISTYENYSNQEAAITTNSTITDNKLGYKTVSGDVSNVKYTWWYRATSDMDRRVLVNNSYSGDQLTGTGIGLTRCVQLHDNTGINAGEKPDIIAVYFGTNDIGRNAELTAFEPLYEQMVDSMQEAYPDADIFLFTLPPMNDADVTDDELKDYNAAIKEIAEEKNCYVVDLYNDSGITWENCASMTIDGGIHPDRAGMKLVADCFTNAVYNAYVKVD